MRGSGKMTCGVDVVAQHLSHNRQRQSLRAFKSRLHSTSVMSAPHDATPLNLVSSSLPCNRSSPFTFRRLSRAFQTS